MQEDRDRKVLLETKYLHVVRRGNWEYVERAGIQGIVAIVPVTRAKELVLVEQHRVPVDAPVIELPAGLADVIEGRDEPLEQAARRELFEETGYEARQLVQLFHGPVSPGLTTEIITFFLAADAERTGPGGGDRHENIRVHAIRLPDVQPWLAARQADGCLVDVKIYAGLYAATRS